MQGFSPLNHVQHTVIKGLKNQYLQGQLSGPIKGNNANAFGLIQLMSILYIHKKQNFGKSSGINPNRDANMAQGNLFSNWGNICGKLLQTFELRT
jgi:hypothetical protein